MIRTIYIIILIYFIPGGIGFYLINRNKEAAVARKSYTKFIVYFFIINILFFSITIRPRLFHYLTILISVAGCIELINLFYRSGLRHVTFFVLSVITYVALCAGFLKFGLLPYKLILFTFLILSIFDSFSQITGQLWGRKKIMPKISPGKTLGGVIGGTIISIVSAFLLRALFTGSVAELIIFTIGTLLFAFAGDLLSSLYKRKYDVKDFNNLIPGHGGFLDRFDSLISGGAWAALCFYFLLI
jgi:phosphatidate cytidylyltransferase